MPHATPPDSGIIHIETDAQGLFQRFHAPDGLVLTTCVTWAAERPCAQPTPQTPFDVTFELRLQDLSVDPDPTYPRDWCVLQVVAIGARYWRIQGHSMIILDEVSFGWADGMGTLDLDAGSGEANSDCLVRSTHYEWTKLPYR
ncbi:MAG: hypothetical protein WCP28_06745 [Actinomycetes bacterium]